MNHNTHCEFVTLIVKAQEGNLSDEEWVLFNNFMQLPENQKIYFEIVKVNSAFQQLESEAFQSTIIAGMDPSYSMYLLEKLAEDEKTAPAIEIIKEAPPRELIQKVIYPPRERQTINKFQIFTFITSVAAILFIALFLRLTPVQRSIKIAALTDSVDVKWANSFVSLNDGDRIHSNEVFSLSKGLVEIQTERGVNLTIEGPAEFEFTNQADLKLDFGRVYASVSPNGIGFTVSTENSKVIDLGTEFGVQVDIGGETELHVLKGKTTLVSGRSWLAKKTQTIPQQQARKISPDGLYVNEIPIRSEAFARSIDSETNGIWRGQTSLNLADVVGGGNGFGSGSTEIWIDPGAGKYNRPSTAKILGEWSGSPDYHVFEEHAFIDGTFIPNGQSGPVQISSVGHKFNRCPITNGSYWVGILNTRWRIWKSQKGGLNNNLDLDGIKYNTRSNPSISLHANQGITFDLRAIQNQFPGAKVDRFTAKSGISQSVLEVRGLPRDENGEMVYPKASFYILVDGEIRLESIDRDPRDPAMDINIPISNPDRFLTLIVTQGSDGSSTNDWTLFAKPFLHIVER